MKSLQNVYPSVLKNGVVSYGGSQTSSENAVMQKCGCGVVAAMDLIIYLNRNHADCKTDFCSEPEANNPIPLPFYNRQLLWLSKRYFPLIPPFGINGIMLVLGLNRFFHDKHMHVSAKWMVSREKLWGRIYEMLDQNIPVVLAVGPNFPLVWQKNRLNFYIKTKDGVFKVAASAKAHYVTATGIDDKWLRISSWGREYYINRIEYENYVKAHSNSVLSNIVYIEKHM